MMATKTSRPARMKAPIRICSANCRPSATALDLAQLAGQAAPGAPVRGPARLAGGGAAEVRGGGAMDLGGGAHVGEPPVEQDRYLVGHELRELHVVGDHDRGVAPPAAQRRAPRG